MKLSAVLKRSAARLYGALLNRTGTAFVGGVRLRLRDGSGGGILGTVVLELQRDQYALSTVPLEPGDVVIDIGAHVGAFACFVAKKHPGVRVVAFEPVPANFESLAANVRANGLRNVVPVNLAVTGDGRDVELMVDLARNSGGGSAQQRPARLATHSYHTVPSTTLDAILEEHAPGGCKLLKIDCEGSEHEILHASRRLGSVAYVRGEFHVNGRLREQGHSVEALASHVERAVGPGRLRYVACDMAE